jgi:hypothetical protein
MRYLTGLPDHEGGKWSPGFKRAGCRTPMQWDASLPNAGFSTAPAERLYLPRDPDPGRPAVAAQHPEPASTLNRVRRLIRLRRGTPSCAPPPRPRFWPPATRSSTSAATATSSSTPPGPPAPRTSRPARTLEASETAVVGGRVAAGAFGYGVFALEPAVGQPAGVTLR